jgi:aryl-alcohol dehydrogenase-like predicted oxidoreductase
MGADGMLRASIYRPSLEMVTFVVESQSCQRRPNPGPAAGAVAEQRAVASASRLGTRLLDLYQVHWPNPVVSDRTIMRGMSTLQRVGLVGVSNYPLARWHAAEEALGGR